MKTNLITRTSPSPLGTTSGRDSAAPSSDCAVSSRISGSTRPRQYTDINWVWRNLLTQGEREKLRTITQTEQLNLLSLAPGAAQAEVSTAGAEVVEVVFAPGDKVPHAEFGEGIVEQQIRDMVFCRFACGKRSPRVWEVHLT
ncbi:MAG: hypothetical protein KME25_18255 [Symplocastrum torsivum CPER-KK1]|jgi:hypothetical protein|uniref:Uncharacterized protein n=1 Tax=Symplocastrum torsivum CPER-KK1 TaxID=450513 RepID=A0A951PMK6_9CYAN|nr:hypothetical protein [Symplocastrum torsivum CPER-KK1]